MCVYTQKHAQKPTPNTCHPRQQQSKASVLKATGSCIQTAMLCYSMIAELGFPMTDCRDILSCLLEHPLLYNKDTSQEAEFSCKDSKANKIQPLTSKPSRWHQSFKIVFERQRSQPENKMTSQPHHDWIDEGLKFMGKLSASIKMWLLLDEEKSLKGLERKQK